MTAVAVLQLRDEGLLDLDDPIGRFVPETGYAAATLRSLLAHTSGMQSEPVGSWWERSPGIDVDALVRGQRRLRCGGRSGGVLPLLQPRLRPARRGGRPAARRAWWDVVRDRVLGPLGMTRTTYHPERRPRRVTASTTSRAR